MAVNYNTKIDNTFLDEQVNRAALHQQMGIQGGEEDLPIAGITPRRARLQHPAIRALQPSRH